jgi:hypothetical protein
MSDLSSKSRVFYPHPPQGGAKKRDGIQSLPLGGLGVRNQRKFEVIGTKINILLKKRLKALLGGFGG